VTGAGAGAGPRRGARRVLRRVPPRKRPPTVRSGVPGAVRAGDGLPGAVRAAAVAETAAAAELVGAAAGLVDPRLVVKGERLLALPAVQAKVGGLSKSTLWKLVKTAEFPAPIRITANRVGWLESEVDAWIARRRLRGRAGR